MEQVKGHLLRSNYQLEGSEGRAVLNALRGEKYTRILPFVRPEKGGIVLREVSGCSSWWIAYWDGKHLWLPGEKEGQWRGCLPSNPDQLDKNLKSIFNILFVGIV